MQRSDRREPELADSLSAVGIDPTSIERLSDAREPVYEVRAGSERYFAKRLQAEKGRAMGDVLERDLDVGMPESRLVRDGGGDGDESGAYLLVMDPADGVPLSLSLPVCLLPGLWTAASDSLSRAVRDVGAGLGELHAGTRSGDRRAGDEACRLADRLVLDRALREHLSDRTVRETERLLDDLRDRRLPFVRIHGDPTPHNLYWDVRTGAADVIDFNLHRSADAEDLVVFESGIELMTARVPYARRSQAATLIDAFRSGYLASGVRESIPSRAIAIGKLAYYAHLLSRYLRGSTSDTRREKLTRYTDRRIVERKVRSLASRL